MRCGEADVTPLPMLRRSAAQRVIAPLLVAFSVVMIVLGKVDQAIFERVRISAIDCAAPLLDGLSRPLVLIGEITDRVRAIVDIYDRNERLREENARLLHWRQAALALASENKELRGLLKLVPESAGSFVSARVIASSGGAYFRNLLVDAGSENGIERGQAAVVGEGLVGRVSEVGTRTARVLLITDLNSRVPVIVEPTGQRAILVGDDSEEPALWYIDPAARLRPGDRIVTSGEGGIFPRALPVGIVATVEPGQPRVEPYARPSQVEFVRIVDYGLARGLPVPVPRSVSEAAAAGTSRTNRR
jgi:rod shape-determining protein MreC